MKALSKRRWLLLVLLVAGLAAGAYAAARSPRKAKKPKRTPIDFATQIRPILETRCIRCHGASKQKGGVRLDRADSIRAHGLVIPGDSAHSLLLSVLTGANDAPQMPPNGEPLGAEQFALIAKWIDEGAKVPEEPAAAAVEHWAFRPPVRTEAPFVPTGPPASRAVLFRRASINLIGLTPTRDELAAFLADTSPHAYENAVDRLLADPRHGERWGRHWMDVWRYSEADGRSSKQDIWWSTPHLWRWRDWIVRSLNEDAGYDRMIREMLAGDELEPPSLEATGYLARSWFKLDRNVWMNATVDHTAKAFLGMSLGCARCHDHKFDPFTQKDYYRFRSVFEPHDLRTDPMPGEAGPAAFITRAYDLNPDANTWLFIRGMPDSPDPSERMLPAVPPVLGTLGPITQTKTGTGRRLALANWITHRNNPLAARVAVNHIWMRHFGRPLVENVADFGLRTPVPARQPLLDRLAVEFMEHGWSMKHLHRLIVTSDAYKAGLEPRPMEAEAIRDSILHLAGVMEPGSGGPPLDPARGADTGLRSIYYRYARDDRIEFLRSFDSPGTEECYRRERSILPQQALELENSAFSWDNARRIARRLDASPEFIVAAFEHILGRPPTLAEAKASEAFLKHQAALLSEPSKLTPLRIEPEPVVKDAPKLPLVFGEAKRLPPIEPHADPTKRAREHLVHALLNHHEFITVR